MQSRKFKLVSRVYGSRRKHLSIEFLLLVKSEDTQNHTRPLPKAYFLAGLPFPKLIYTTKKSKPVLSKLNHALQGSKFCWETSRHLQIRDGGEKKKVEGVLARLFVCLWVALAMRCCCSAGACALLPWAANWGHGGLCND